MTDMSLEAAVRARRSVRGFLPDPVPQETLDKVFDLARWSPSGTNIQPWQVYVASGATRDHLREQFMQRARTNTHPALTTKTLAALLARSGRPPAGMCGRVVRRDGCGLGR